MREEIRGTVWGALLCAPLVAGCSVVGVRSVEEQVYTTDRAEGDIELRAYAPAVVAETRVDEGDWDDDTSAGFRRLFDYITGDNERAERIDMTAPVVVEDGGDGEEIPMTAPVLIEEAGSGRAMAFVMPAGSELESLPRPTDERVVLRALPATRTAVIRFAGTLSPERVDEQRELLEAWIEAEGLEAVSRPRAAGYDPPWTIPWFRRNEVQIDVR